MTVPKQGEYWIRRSDGAKVGIIHVAGVRERDGVAIAAVVHYRKTRPTAGRSDSRSTSTPLERFQKLYRPDPGT